MATRWKCLVVLLALFASVRAYCGAGFAENRDYAAAVLAFRDDLWERAEAEFAHFIEKYPKSDHVAAAVLAQAEAQYCQATNHLARQRPAEARQKLSEAIALLRNRQSGAGKLADQYLYWIGEAEFQNGNFSGAAGVFAQLGRDFPASDRLLAGAVGEAAARAKLKEWARVVQLLGQPGGAFDLAAKAGAAGDLTDHGQLLRAEAELALTNYAGAEAALKPLEGRKLKPELDWRHKYLLAQAQLAAGRAEEAARTSEGLAAAAELAGRRDLLAESMGLRGMILEQLQRREEAVAAFQRNLAGDVPAGRQRHALLKVTELLLALNRPGDAAATLERFLSQFPNAPAADAALLALGELYLKQHPLLAGTNAPAAAPAPTHLWAQALTNFDRILAAFTNSPLAGKAQFDRGWCFWISNQFPASAEAFKVAVARLPASEDQVVARFKLGDALFELKDFPGALQNYRDAAAQLSSWPRLAAALGDQVMYQALRAAIELKDLAAATNALQRLLDAHAASGLAARAALLSMQALADLGDAEGARAVFAKIAVVQPASELRPEMELILACVRGRKGEWVEAIAEYDSWLERFPTNALRPRAEFDRAWVTDQAGQKTNAFALVTNFVARFPTDELAPRAQWWIADYFHGQGDFPNAEKNYKKLFQDWPGSELAYEARMNAGRAAVERLGYTDAIDHFTSLTRDTNCPRLLRVQAVFAYGSALMRLDPGGPNKFSNFEKAAEVFATIPPDYPTNEQAALAWGEMGNCYLQLAASDARYYELSSNAFQQAASSPYAALDARCQALVGLGSVLEKMAESKSGDEQAALLKEAMNHYVDVFYQKTLRAGETPIPFWVKKTGLEAARVAETLKEWTQAVKLYQRLQQLLPPLKETLDKKIERVQEHLRTAGN